MSEDLVANVSPNAGPLLKKNLKLPMILYTLSSGLSGGTSLAMIKSFGEVLNNEERD